MKRFKLYQNGHGAKHGTEKQKEVFVFWFCLVSAFISFTSLWLLLALNLG